MTYAISSALQKAVYGVLQADAALTGLIGTSLFDSAPSGALPELYVTLGEERVLDRSDQSGAGALHELTIAVVSDASGFLAAKDVAAAICDALIGSTPALDRGRLVFLEFDRALARKARSGSGREIDLRFRARVEDI